MKYVILAFLTAISLSSFARELCIDHSNQLKFVFNNDSNGQLKSVDFYQRENLIFADSGKKSFGFLQSICHVNGSLNTGKFVTIGECTNFDRENNQRLLTINETGESFDLREFDCRFED